MYDYMQLTMVLILVNVTFPPNLLYSIQRLMGAAFTFLPNMFKAAYSHAIYNEKYLNNNIYSLW